MKEYLDLLKKILEQGEDKGDRTNTGVRSLFGAQLRFDLRDGFPLVTTKKVLFSAVVRELLWFIKGSTNINDDLAAHTPIWNAWADQEGELGPIYGYQWRHWEQFTLNPNSSLYEKKEIDQLSELLHSIKHNPNSRRHIVSAWNPSDIPKMALPPCHALFQFYVCNQYLDCQLYQRSADMALGVPFNIASYALLLMLVAQECQLTPRYFVHTFGDAHIYHNHFDGVNEQLKRLPKPLPQVVLAKKPFFNMTFDDIQLHNYEHDSFIKFPIAV
jgi:thymidylate synthase